MSNQFNFTPEQVKQAVEKAKSEAKPNSWGAEDEGYWEYMGELESIMESYEDGSKTLEDACSWVGFNPGRYL